VLVAGGSLFHRRLLNVSRRSRRPLTRESSTSIAVDINRRKSRMTSAQRRIRAGAKPMIRESAAESETYESESRVAASSLNRKAATSDEGGK